MPGEPDGDDEVPLLRVLGDHQRADEGKGQSAKLYRVFGKDEAFARSSPI